MEFENSFNNSFDLNSSNDVLIKQLKNHIEEMEENELVFNKLN